MGKQFRPAPKFTPAEQKPRVALEIKWILAGVLGIVVAVVLFLLFLFYQDYQRKKALEQIFRGEIEDIETEHKELSRK